MYSIKQAADKLGVSIHTLRYYEKEGLTPFIKRDGKGNRCYSEQDIEWIYMLRCLRDTGMPIRWIFEYVSLCEEGDYTILERYALIKEYQAFVIKKRQEIDVCLKLIDGKIDYYEKILQSDSENFNCSSYKDEWERLKQTGR